MPQVFGPLIAGWLVSAGVTTLAAAAIGSFIGSVLLSFALTKLQSLLSPSKARSSALAAQQVTVNDTVAPGIIIYGETRVSGVIAFYGCSGTGNRFLWFVIWLSAHQLESISDIWLDGTKINEADINGSSGLVSGGTPAWNGKLYIWKHLGTSAQAADANVIAAIPSWTSANKGAGCGYIVVRMELDPEVFTGGAPQNYYARVRGKRVYDPRLDSTNGGIGSQRYTNPSTWAWSNNSVLCAADYLTGGHAWYDVSSVSDLAKLGMNELPSRIDWAQVAADATVCDDLLSVPNSASEKRYVCNGALSTTLTHSENMARILSSAAASCIYTGGLYRIFVGQYNTPTLAISDNDLAGEYQVETSVGDGAIFNAVNGVYTDITRDWQPVTSYLRTNPGYEAADGRRVIKTIELPMVTSETHAQRLSEIENRQGRNQTVVTLTLGLNGFKLRTWDTFTWTNTELGYINKVFRMTQWSLDPTGPQCKIVARDEYPTTYPVFDISDFGTPTNTGLGNQFDLPDAPSNLKTQGLANAILISWDPPTTVFSNTAYEVQESASSTMSSPITVYQGADLQFTIAKPTTGSTYYRVRAKRGGRVSDWDPSTGGTLGAASSVLSALSASVAPGSISSSGGATQTTVAAVVSAAGGTPAYTHAWVWLTGGTGITITSASAASTTFSVTGMAIGETRSGNAKDTVTDSVAATKIVNVAVTITRPTFAVVANNVVKSASGFGGSGTVNSSGKPPNTTPSGGTSPYTYVWSYVSTSSGNTPSISSSTAQNPTWSASVTDGTDSTSLWRVTATDAASSTAFIQITVNLVWNNLQ